MARGRQPSSGAGGTLSVREDASTFHTFYMDVHSDQRGDTHQGFSDSSAGRAARRGIYGFALGYAHTGDAAARASRRLAHYFLTAFRKILSATGIVFTPKITSTGIPLRRRSRPAASGTAEAITVTDRCVRPTATLSN
ncbi:MAG: hypothetical protein ACLR17_10360 [Enterobacteriaceae bacterium]